MRVDAKKGKLAFSTKMNRRVVMGIVFWVGAWLAACLPIQPGQAPLVRLASLPDALDECSGLIQLPDGRYIGLNDSGDQAVLYRFESGQSKADRIVVSGATNRDWEELATDSTYLYISDTGNNGNTRDDLCVYRVPLAGLEQLDTVLADRIGFAYPGRTSYQHSNRHNYDCEAIIARQGQLYFFSKNRGNGKSDVYRIPASPGQYTGEKIGQIDAGGLVTGADWRPGPEGRIELVLVGYNALSKKLYKPFLLYASSLDLADVDQGAFKRYDLGEFLQTETVVFSGPREVTLTNEGEHGDPAYLYRLDLD